MWTLYRNTTLIKKKKMISFNKNFSKNLKVTLYLNNHKLFNNIPNMGEISSNFFTYTTQKHP